MPNQAQTPDDAKLRARLRESWPAPSLPPRFQESVWRRIESAETATIQTPSPFAWLDHWIERLLVPRFALASLALMLVAGGLTGVIHSASDGAAKQQARERYLTVVAPSFVR